VLSLPVDELLLHFGLLCCSGVVAVGSAFALQTWYMASPELQSSVESLLRLSSVEGSEVLMLVAAFAIGQFLQLFLMMVASIKLFSINYSLLWRLLWQSVVAGMTGGVIAYGVLRFLVDGINQDTFLGILLQGFIAGVAGLVSVVTVYHLCRSPELREIFKSFDIRLSRRPQSNNSMN